MILKFCLGCGRWLSTAQFYPRKTEPYAYPRCKACVKAKAIWGQNDKRQKEGAMPHFIQDEQADFAICSKCGRRLPMGEFRSSNWYCPDCRRQSLRESSRRQYLRRSNERRRQRNAVEVEIPNHTGDWLLLAGGVLMLRSQHQCTVPGARLYVDIWQGTDEAGQLYQGWHWAMYYD